MRRFSRRRASQMLLGLIALLLASTLVFLYLKSSRDQTATYTQSRDLIRQLQQLNAQWDSEVLKARIAITHNYDPLVTPLSDMTRIWSELQGRDTYHNPADLPSWQASQAAYVAAIQEKARLVDQFKSHNAVLRNSLAFLPTAEDDIQAQFNQIDDQGRLQLQSVATDTYDLLLSSLEFAQVTSDERAADILVGLGKLAINKQSLPSEFQAPVDILSNHISLILREQPLVNSLLERIAAVPVAERLDDLTTHLNQDQQTADLVDHQYHRYLLIFSTLLVVLLLYLAVRLLRSFAEINRVNRALQSANETLEQRVERRTQQLKDAQSELLDSARQAGMAEIATNVLHNVGNVLNSVNISAELVSRKLRGSKALGLGKAMQLINAHQGDLGSFFTEDEKGKLLPGYLNQLVEAIAVEQQGMSDELAQLSKSIDHIKDIVSTQQSYAGAATLLEPINIGALMDDALRMNAGALSRHHVTVVKEYAQVPQILGDKHRLLLIMVNLISNAKYAMSNLSERQRQITLKVEAQGEDTLKISVKDDGEGIPPENMTRIFTHGFTTRKEGHGFGLHSCALAAVQMHGQLSAHSDGPGLGAVFTLTIPLTLAGSSS
ncbi:DAHL domain-containing protein [Pseudomonas synxantha]|uniref:histidine kinase n=1 Tax=Pseudomonas synxantha TaxID=47883 RepID=A0A5D3GCH5_9PSED|nr:DAHL domain-containing protein [Pseudomonas synxantha]TYK58004.1 GHKL domain-containing protein [Pseudomonas synxantha]